MAARIGPRPWPTLQHGSTSIDSRRVREGLDTGTNRIVYAQKHFLDTRTNFERRLAQGELLGPQADSGVSQVIAVCSNPDLRLTLAFRQFEAQLNSA